MPVNKAAKTITVKTALEIHFISLNFTADSCSPAPARTLPPVKPAPFFTSSLESRNVTATLNNTIITIAGRSLWKRALISVPVAIAASCVGPPHGTRFAPVIPKHSRHIIVLRRILSLSVIGRQAARTMIKVVVPDPSK